MRNKKLLNAIRLALEMQDELLHPSEGACFDSQTLVDSKKEHEKALTDECADDHLHLEKPDIEH
jgi:hypothetical protein